MNVKTIIIALVCSVGAIHAQKYKAFFQQDSLDKILPNFNPDIPVWPKSTGNVKFAKDTVLSMVLKVWVINSGNYNESIYGIYTDTMHVITPNWKSRKNYITNIEKYGAGKAMFFFFRDGIPLSRSDINDLRRHGEIPGLREE